MRVYFLKDKGGYSGKGYTFSKKGEVQDIKKEVAEYLIKTFPKWFESVEPVKSAPKKEEENTTTKDK